ncbi:hypothetical protein D3C85_1521680 [compost metagenome]
MGQRSQCLHVVHVAGLVVDVSDHDHRSILVNGLPQLFGTIDKTQYVALLQQVCQALRDVQICREVVGF